MSSSVQETEVQKVRKDKKDRKEKKKKENMEMDGRQENRHLKRGNDDEKPERSSKKRKSSDAEQSTRAGNATRILPSVQDKKKKQRTSTSTPISRDQLLTNHTPFLQQRTSLYLPLSLPPTPTPPRSLRRTSLPLTLDILPPLHGVVLSYSEPRLSEHPEAAPTPVVDLDDGDDNEQETGKIVLAQSLNEYGTPYTWLTATFTLFRPRRGTWLEGEINLQNESLLGMVCYNYFNAIVEREELPNGWRWMDVSDGAGERRMTWAGEIGEGGGHFVDTEGKRVQGRVVFRVVDFEIVGGVDGAGGSVSIVGSLKEG